jgi:hypothetical protein
MVPDVHDRRLLILISPLIIVFVVVRIDPRILIALLWRVPVNGNEQRE